MVPVKDAPKLNDLVDKQIKDALDAELATKGLTKTDNDSVDLYIGYQTAIAQEKQFSSFSSDWGYGPGWYRVSSRHVRLQGHDLVWRGVPSKTFDTNAKPGKQHRRIWQRRLKLLGFPRSRRPLCLGFSKLLY